MQYHTNLYLYFRKYRRCCLSAYNWSMLGFSKYRWLYQGLAGISGWSSKLWGANETSWIFIKWLELNKCVYVTKHIQLSRTNHFKVLSDDIMFASFFLWFSYLSTFIIKVLKASVKRTYLMKMWLLCTQNLRISHLSSTHCSRTIALTLSCNDTTMMFKIQIKPQTLQIWIGITTNRRKIFYLLIFLIRHFCKWQDYFASLLSAILCNVKIFSWCSHGKRRKIKHANPVYIFHLQNIFTQWKA